MCLVIRAVRSEILTAVGTLQKSKQKKLEKETDKIIKSQQIATPPTMIPNRNISMEELSEHDTKNEEKWIAVDDVVFDVSNFKHPGGGSVMAPHLGKSAVRRQVESHSTRPLIHNSLQIADGNIYGTSFLDRSEEVFTEFYRWKALEIGDKDKRENIEEDGSNDQISRTVGDYISQNHRTFKSDTQSSYAILDFDTFDMDSETIFPLLALLFQTQSRYGVRTSSVSVS